jgi:hypothetical protein
LNLLNCFLSWSMSVDDLPCLPLIRGGPTMTVGNGSCGSCGSCVAHGNDFVVS